MAVINKIFAVLFAALFLSSCAGDAARSRLDSLPVDTSAVAGSTNPLIATGKALLDSSHDLVKASMLGKIPVKKANMQIKPIMIQYFALVKKLPPADTMILYNYRIRFINDLIDLKLKQNN